MKCDIVTMTRPIETYFHTYLLALSLLVTACNSVDVQFWHGSSAQRSRHDVARRGVVIPNTGDVISASGVIKNWRAYLSSDITKTSSRVRLQIWRPILNDQTYVAHLIGQSDQRAVDVFGVGDHTFHLEHHERIRVEVGDLMGVHFEGGNPIPFEEFPNCASGGETKTMEVYNSEDYAIDIEDNASRRFASVTQGKCRTYSVAVQITIDECTDIVAGSTTEELLSDGYPTSYLPSTDACWIIHPGAGGLPIELVVEDMGLSSSCQYRQDYVEIRKGSSSTSPMLHHYCSKMTSHSAALDTFESDVGGTLYIRFVTDSFREGKGFRFRYRSVLQPGRSLQIVQCDVILMDKQPFTLTSPNYPANYPPDKAMCWILTTPMGNSRVHIEVVDSSLEPRSEDTVTRTATCLDSIKIHDGDSQSSPRLGEWCGRDKPTGLVTSGPELLVWFTSNGRQEDRGFRLDLYTLVNDDIRCTKLMATTREQYVESDGYPYQYPPGTRACWIIEAPIGLKVILKLHETHIEASESCSYDYLEIRDGLEGARLLSRVCGTDTGSEIISSGRHLYLNFQSDNAIQNTGFRIGYNQIVPDACSVYTAYPRYLDIASAGYDQGLNYPIDIDTCWTIESPLLNSRIKLEIIDFELENSEECVNDYVEFYDGPDVSGAVLGRWCGLQHDGGIITNGASVTIRFVSNSATTGPGFRLSYISMPLHDCVYLYASDKERVLTANDHPWNTDTQAVSCWVIQADQGHDVISIDVRNVSVRGPSLVEERCDQDWLTVKDGNFRSSNILCHVCGDDVPSGTLVTSGQFAFVSFVTENALGYFRLTYRSHADERCQNLFADRSLATVTSPGYPVMYAPYSFNCWIIQASREESTVRLIIDDIDLDNNCHDYIDVNDGGRVKDAQLRHWCSLKRPNDISSSGSVVSIRFVSNGQDHGRGFKLRYWEEFVLEDPVVPTSPSPVTSSPRPLPTTVPPSTPPPTPPPTPHATTPILFPTTTSLPISSTALTMMTSSTRKTTTSGEKKKCINRSLIPNDSVKLLSSQQFSYDPRGGLTECWIIYNINGVGTIRITVTSVIIQSYNRGPCVFSKAYLEIKDGTRRDMPVLARLCSLGRAMEINTTGPSFYVYFTTRSDEDSFALQYINQGAITDEKPPLEDVASSGPDSALSDVFIGVVSAAGTLVLVIILVMVYICCIRRERDIPLYYPDDPYVIPSFVNDDDSFGLNSAFMDELAGIESNGESDTHAALEGSDSNTILRARPGRSTKAAKLGLSNIGSTLRAMATDPDFLESSRLSLNNENNKNEDSLAPSSSSSKTVSRTPSLLGRTSSVIVPQPSSLCLLENVDNDQKEEQQKQQGSGKNYDKDYVPKPNERMI